MLFAVASAHAIHPSVFDPSESADRASGSWAKRGDGLSRRRGTSIGHGTELPGFTEDPLWCDSHSDHTTRRTSLRAARWISPSQSPCRDRTHLGSTLPLFAD